MKKEHKKDADGFYYYKIDVLEIKSGQDEEKKSIVKSYKFDEEEKFDREQLEKDLNRNLEIIVNDKVCRIDECFGREDGGINLDIAKFDKKMSEAGLNKDQIENFKKIHQGSVAPSAAIIINEMISREILVSSSQSIDELKKPTCVYNIMDDKITSYFGKKYLDSDANPIGDLHVINQRDTDNLSKHIVYCKSSVPIEGDLLVIASEMKADEKAKFNRNVGEIQNPELISRRILTDAMFKTLKDGIENKHSSELISDNLVKDIKSNARDVKVSDQDLKRQCKMLAVDSLKETGHGNNVSSKEWMSNVMRKVVDFVHGLFGKNMNQAIKKDVGIDLDAMKNVFIKNENNTKNRSTEEKKEEKSGGVDIKNAVIR